MQIEELRDGTGCTLRLAGELDMAGVPSLEAAAGRVWGEVSTLTVDLSELSFIDSTGLAAIVHLSGLCARHRCRFQIVPGPDAVQRLFELTGLDGVLPFVSRAGGD
jgi:anti-sigma B factor antagonist